MITKPKETLKNYIRNILSPAHYEMIREMYRALYGKIYANDLKRLAIFHGTDKDRNHSYIQHYKTHFNSIRKRKLNILEIGVGGYKKLTGGASLRMWSDYFPNSMIYGIDIYPKKISAGKKIKIFQGSQIDKRFLEEVYRQTGPLDIIIDDGSHNNEHVITSFKILFPLLSKNGIYVIEDVQTSYYKNYGGDSENLNNPKTQMNYLKGLLDGLNYMEFENPAYKPSYFDLHIISVHFYHNLVFFYKGLNDV